MAKIRKNAQDVKSVSPKKKSPGSSQGEFTFAMIKKVAQERNMNMRTASVIVASKFNSTLDSSKEVTASLKVEAGSFLHRDVLEMRLAVSAGHISETSGYNSLVSRFPASFAMVYKLWHMDLEDLKAFTMT